MKTSLSGLLARLEETARDLPGVSHKRMFGCDALFASGSIFALVWKLGRIGVRLPVPELYSALMDRKGSAPWKAGDMTMAHWVLVPEGFHDQPRVLGEWVKWAHGLALGARTSAAKKAKAKPKAREAKVTAKTTAKAETKAKAKAKTATPKTSPPAKKKSAAPARKARER